MKKLLVAISVAGSIMFGVTPASAGIIMVDSTPPVDCGIILEGSVPPENCGIGVPQ
ncbi:hypothetical protein [Streptomyces wedmorensis]